MSNLNDRKALPPALKAAAATAVGLSGAPGSARRPFAIDVAARPTNSGKVIALPQAHALRGAPPVRRRQSALARLLLHIGTLAQWIAAVRAHRRAARELALLDDRMLADIGLTRADIPRVLWRLPGESTPRRLR